MSGSNWMLSTRIIFFRQLLAYFTIYHKYAIGSEARRAKTQILTHLNSSAKSTIEDMSHFSIFFTWKRWNKFDQLLIELLQTLGIQCIPCVRKESISFLSTNVKLKYCWYIGSYDSQSLHIVNSIHIHLEFDAIDSAKKNRRNYRFSHMAEPQTDFTVHKPTSILKSIWGKTRMNKSRDTHIHIQCKWGQTGDKRLKRKHINNGTEQTVFNNNISFVMGYGFGIPPAVCHSHITFHVNFDKTLSIATTLTKLMPQELGIWSFEEYNWKHHGDCEQALTIFYSVNLTDVHRRYASVCDRPCNSCLGLFYFGAVRW